MDLKITLTPFEALVITTSLRQAFDILSKNSCNRSVCFVLDYLINKIDEVVSDEAKK